MAAVDTTTAGETHRAVARSKRLMRWQHDLRSNNQAVYGACRQYDNEKSDKGRTYQRISADMGGQLKVKVLEEKHEGEPDCHDDTSKIMTRRQQSQKHDQGLNCQKLPKDANADHQCRTRDAYSKQEAFHGGLQQGEDSMQLHQPKHIPQQNVIRTRQRHAVTESQEIQPSRSPGCEIGNHRNSKGSKRSSRLLAHELGIEKSAPAPLKLPKLQVVLSRKEFQEDWREMTGQRYVGKPKKSGLIQLGLGLCTSMMCPSTIRRYLKDD